MNFPSLSLPLPLSVCVQVGNLKDMYHFELEGNGGEHSPHKTQALEAEEMVY